MTIIIYKMSPFDSILRHCIALHVITQQFCKIILSSAHVSHEVSPIKFS